MQTHLPSLETADVIESQTRIPRWRLYELARAGQIPHVRLGRAIRFDPDAVRHWLASGGTASTSTDAA